MKENLLLKNITWRKFEDFFFQYCILYIREQSPSFFKFNIFFYVYLMLYFFPITRISFRISENLDVYYQHILIPNI